MSMSSRPTLAKYMASAEAMNYEISEGPDGALIESPPVTYVCIKSYLCIKWRDINWQSPAYARDVKFLRQQGFIVRESASNVLVYKPRFPSYADKKAHRERSWREHHEREMALVAQR